jgi:hypothetical protein
MKKILLLSLLAAISTLYGQKTGEVREGKVTFVSSQNVYVQFATTEGIFEKDTLWMVVNGKETPAVIVNFISSKSVAGNKIGEIKIEKEMILKVYPSVVVKKEDVVIEEPVTPVITEQPKVLPNNRKPVEKKNYRGRFSVQSSSDISNISGSPGNQRWRYGLSFNADKINGSNFSFSTYNSFSYLTRDWGREDHDLGRKLKIYELKGAYAFDSLSFLNFGRFVYRKISNIGAVDGLLYEQSLGKKWSGGLFAGSRPNMLDYGYNFKLFQFGVYAAQSDTLGTGLMENSIGFVNQTNDFKTDRRFIYLQHTSNPVTSLSFFASSEIDLYKLEAGEGKTSPDLTNLFLSTRYAFSREYNINLSYDVRKNVIYYETYRSFIDSVLFNETLQGLRIGFNTTAVKNLSISLRTGFRNMGNDARSSSDYGLSLYYSNVPYIAGYISANVGYLKSVYVEGLNFGLGYSRNITESLYSTVGYRNINYEFSRGDSKLSQNIISFDLNYTVNKVLNLGLNYEGVFEGSFTTNRLFVDLTTRF